MYLYFSIFALICFIAYDLISRKVGMNSKNPTLFSGIYNLTIAALTPLLIFIEPIKLDISLSLPIIFITILSIICWALFGRFEYHAHKHIEASTLSILTKISPIITALLSYLIFKEELNLYKIFAIGLIIGANIWIIFVLEKNFSLKGKLMYGIIVACLLGIGWTFDKALSPHFGLVLYTFLSFTPSGLLNLLIPLPKIEQIKEELKATPYRKIILLGFINLIGYAALTKAFLSGGPGGIVTTVATATTPFVVLLGYFFLKEKSHFYQKIIASIVTIAGIILLNI